MNYQPLWVNGKTVGPDIRQSAGRYDVIAACLRAIIQPGFSVLDVGAQSGYFAVRLNHEFGARVTAVDGAPELLSGLDAMERHTVAGVVRFLQPGDLRTFRPVDVVLCLSVLHHVTWWSQMLDEMLEMSRMVFVECAVPEEEIGKDPELLREQHALVRSLPDAMHVGSAVGYDNRHKRPMYLVPGRLSH